MAQPLQVYRDNAASAVIFKPATVGEQFLNALHATVNDDGTLDVVHLNSRNQAKVLLNFDHTRIRTQSGAAAGVTVEEVVDYLNSQFTPQGVTGVPVITSPLAVTLVEGEPLNYTITATNDPVYFSATGLPAGLFCNNSTGAIFGSTTVVGVAAVTLTAVNGFGASTAILTLTVEAAAGFHSTTSLRFLDDVHQQHVVVATTAAIERTSLQAWSLSLWVYLDVLDDWDLWSYGQNSNHTIRLGVRASGAIAVTFTNAHGHTLDLSFGAITAGAWHHLVLTNSGANTPAGVKVYLDNVAQAQVVVANTINGAAATAGNMRLARASGNKNASVWLDGYMDEVAYFDTELTAGNVTTLWNGGSPGDLSLLGFVGDMKLWYRMGDGDTFPTVLDASAGGLHPGTMINMTAGSLVSFVP